MLIPFIQKFRSSKPPWEVYKNIYAASRVSFFLDSGRYQPPNQVFSYLGANPFLEVTLRHGRIRIEGEETADLPAAGILKTLRHLFKKHAYVRSVPASFFTGGAVGYWGYEMASFFDKIRFRKKTKAGVPLLYLGFYREVIVYDHRKKTYWLVTHIDGRKRKSRQLKRNAQERLDYLKKYFETNETPSPLSSPPRGGEGGVRGKVQFQFKQFHPEISKTRFKQIVGRAKEYIEAGDIYQANLSQRFSFRFKGPSLELYEALRKINPSPFASFLKIGDIEIVSSSPERLIRKRGNRCETQPIAGTRPRRGRGKSEKELEQELLHNEKERAEHIMLVDLERNDLGRVCEWPSVRVADRMKIEKYSHVIHLVSKVVGRLKKGKDAFDLIQAVFPGGTITGCPKIRCMQIIDELEPVERGIYTGSIGYIDFRGDLDLNLVIRTLVLQKNKGYFQVGAGIVYDSDPAKEYEETLHKGEALAEALAQASI